MSAISLLSSLFTFRFHLLKTRYLWQVESSTDTCKKNLHKREGRAQENVIGKYARKNQRPSAGKKTPELNHVWFWFKLWLVGKVTPSLWLVKLQYSWHQLLNSENVQWGSALNLKEYKPSKFGQHWHKDLITSLSTYWQQLNRKHTSLLPHFSRNLCRQRVINLVHSTGGGKIRDIRDCSPSCLLVTMLPTHKM